MNSTAFIQSYCGRATPTSDVQSFNKAFRAHESPRQALEWAAQVGIETFEPASVLSTTLLPPPLSHPQLQRRCENMLSRILPAAGAAALEVSLHLSGGFAPLAGALPGQIWVDAPRTQELSDGALCFLLSHEVGHLVAEDHAGHAGREKALELLGQNFEAFDFEALEELQPVLEANQSMDLEMEHRADRLAGQVTRALGYDSRAAASEVLGLLYSSEAGSSLEKSHGTLIQRLQAAGI